ncbi:MAG: cysteine desulfurase family protein [Bdellovibrionales bacterium]
MRRLIYLDYNATTPVDERVLEAMLPFWKQAFGNPASQLHAKGWESKRAVDQARESVAALLRCQPADIVFTTGATESNNWALKGLIEQIREENPGLKPHVLTSNIEHASVREPLLDLQRKGLIDVDFLPVDSEGFLSLEVIKRARRSETRLISLIWAHNEIGTLQNISEIARWAHGENIFTHSDATQAVGKIPVPLDQIPLSLLSFSGHKLYGPKGVGALFVRQKDPKVLLKPLLHGGGQERLGRSGTLNVPAIVGLGKACEIAREEMAADRARFADLQEKFWSHLKARFPKVKLNGPIKHRSVYNLNVTFPGVPAHALLPKIQNLCVSGGSACSSGLVQGNPVLLALGHSAQDDSISLRLSWGKMTTAQDFDDALEILSKSLKSLEF